MVSATVTSTRDRILVVEDNYLVSSALRNLLEDFGWEVVGPVASVDEGMAHAASEKLTGAVLDINIIGGTSAPIAERLRERRCPFLFISGYGSPVHLPPPLRAVRRLAKPIEESVLKHELDRLIADA